MKKNSILIIMLLFAMTAHAQFEDKNWVVGGNFRLSRTSVPTFQTNNSITDFSISPQIGKVLTPNQLIGLRTVFTSNSNIDGNLFGIGLWYRWHVALKNSFFPVYFNFNAGIDYINDFFNNDFIAFSFTPGFTIPLNDRWLINLSYGNVSLSLSEETRFNLSAGGFGFGLNFTIP